MVDPIPKSNQENQYPSITKDTAYSITITNNFPEEQLPIYWGPNQNTAFGYLPTEPNGWNDNAVLSLPMIVRFCFDSTPISFSPPPPPPPPTTRPVAWILDLIQSIPYNPTSNFAVAYWFLQFQDTKLPATFADASFVIVAVCPGELGSCRCGPDCNGVPKFFYTQHQFTYAYPCGDVNDPVTLKCSQDGL